MALDRPALLRLQLRALLRAAQGRNLKIMVPMIAEVDEFRRARAILMQAQAYYAARGYAPPASIKIGTMIEVPSLLWQLDQLLPETDFVSVGSNDLVQFLFAADRGHPKLAQRYDTLSPPVLSVLREIAARSPHHEVPLTLCGEMAGRPLEAMALLGVGLTSISMNPASIGPVKAMLMALDVGKLQAFLTPLLTSGARSVREELKGFAAQHGIPV